MRWEHEFDGYLNENKEGRWVEEEVKGGESRMKLGDRRRGTWVYGGEE